MPFWLHWQIPISSINWKVGRISVTNFVAPCFLHATSSKWRSYFLCWLISNFCIEVIIVKYQYTSISKDWTVGFLYTCNICYNYYSFCCSEWNVHICRNLLHAIFFIFLPCAMPKLNIFLFYPVCNKIVFLMIPNLEFRISLVLSHLFVYDLL